MKVKVRKQNAGITLIVLVITIIVLLILAGISIAMLSRRKWNLKQGQKSKRGTFNRTIHGRNQFNYHRRNSRKKDER